MYVEGIYLISGVSSVFYENGVMEKRMIYVALRHGLNDYIVPKWKATFEIKKYFEAKIGKSIYDILPGVAENTFK